MAGRESLSVSAISGPYSPHDSIPEQGRSRLFSSVLGDSRQLPKYANRTARLLEEQFILDGWPLGRIYGRETELAQRFGVGRAIVRETARILEIRGTARMRRGRRGGLELTAPSSERVFDMIGGYCYLVGVPSDQVTSARLTMDRILAYISAQRRSPGEFSRFEYAPSDPRNIGSELRRFLTARANNSVVSFFSECLDLLSEIQLPHDSTVHDDSASQVRRGGLQHCIERLMTALRRGDTHAAAAWAGACSKRTEASKNHATAKAPVQHQGAQQPSIRRSRAAQIFDSLMRQLEPGQWVDGRMLGNEFELCERYCADRGVLRQAIRILEAAEAAASLPGRGRGLVARTPGPAAISRLICSHFAANHVDFQDSFEAFKWLGVEMSALAARQTNLTGIADIEIALSALQHRDDAVRTSELIAIEERQFALARHPVLELFLRSAKAYPSWVMRDDLPVPEKALRDFLDCSHAVTAAIASRNPVAAAAAQEEKFMLLKRNFDCLFEEYCATTSNRPRHA